MAVEEEALDLLLEAAETGDCSKWYAYVEERFPGASKLLRFTTEQFIPWLKSWQGLTKRP